MRWFTRLFGHHTRPTSDSALWIYVRCQRCGEAIGIRADHRYDLVSAMLDPGEEGPAYTLHKDIVGNACFQRITVDLAFDRRQTIVARQITGGTFISAEEYHVRCT